MDLVLWRHAEALDAMDEQEDMSRALTGRGEKQAARIAHWLDRRLPEGTRVLVSPALRCAQTAKALGRKFKTWPELATGGTVEQLLEAAQWPQGKATVLIVGHQPVLGQAIARLLDLRASECVVKRGAVWWLRNRGRRAMFQTVVVAVHSPEMH